MSLVNSDFRWLALPGLCQELKSHHRTGSTGELARFLAQRLLDCPIISFHSCIQSLDLRSYYKPPDGISTYHFELDLCKALLTLPNLTHLKTGGLTLLPQLVSTLLAGTVRHLDIRRAHVLDDWKSLVPSHCQASIETLRLGNLEVSKGSDFHYGFLCLCATRLKRLEVMESRDCSYEDLTSPFHHRPLRLDALRQALVYQSAENDMALRYLNAILASAATLDSLQLKLWDSDGTRNALFNMRQTRSLRAIRCHDVLAFHVLRKNLQIEKLDLPSDVLADDQDLQHYLLPAIISMQPFLRLTCLSLCVWSRWRNGISGFAPETLVQIGKITSLKQLCLVSGDRWKMNYHDELRRALQPLTQLRHLAFCEDNYAFDYPHSEFWFEDFPRDYGPDNTRYMKGLAPEDYKEEAHILGDNLGTEDFEIFEQVHLIRMSIETKVYVEFFPRLSWLHIGQHTMLISQGVATAAHPKRRLTGEEQHLLLRRTFGTKDKVFSGT